MKIDIRAFFETDSKSTFSIICSAVGHSTLRTREKIHEHVNTQDILLPVLHLDAQSLEAL